MHSKLTAPPAGFFLKMPLNWCDEAPCFPLGIWEERGRITQKHWKLSLFGKKKIFFFLLPRCQPSVCAIVSQSVTHKLSIVVPLKASFATSLMPLLVSRLSGGRGAKAANIKLLLPHSTRSVLILKRRFFHFFVLLAQRSEPLTLQRFDLKGSRRRVKPQRQEELCVFSLEHNFTGRKETHFCWEQWNK